MGLRLLAFLSASLCVVPDDSLLTWLLHYFCSIYPVSCFPSISTSQSILSLCICRVDRFKDKICVRGSFPPACPSRFSVKTAPFSSLSFCRICLNLLHVGRTSFFPTHPNTTPPRGFARVFLFFFTPCLYQSTPPPLALDPSPHFPDSLVLFGSPQISRFGRFF